MPGLVSGGSVWVHRLTSRGCRMEHLWMSRNAWYLPSPADTAPQAEERARLSPRLDTSRESLTYVRFKGQRIFSSLLVHYMFKETARMLDMWSHFYGNGVGVSLPRWDNVTFHWCHCNAFLLQWILCASVASHGAFQSECLQWKVSRSKYFFLLFYFSLVLVPMVNVYQTRVLHCGIPAGFTKSVLLG